MRKILSLLIITFVLLSAKQLVAQNECSFTYSYSKDQDDEGDWKSDYSKLISPFEIRVQLSSDNQYIVRFIEGGFLNFQGKYWVEYVKYENGFYKYRVIKSKNYGSEKDFRDISFISTTTKISSMLKCIKSSEIIINWISPDKWTAGYKI